MLIILRFIDHHSVCIFCNCDSVHRRMGQFFSRRLNHLCPKSFLTAPEKTAILTCKIALPDSSHPVITSKNPGFQALYLSRLNGFRFFSFLAAGFCPKNLAFARKIVALPESGGSLRPLARSPMILCCFFAVRQLLRWEN